MEWFDFERCLEAVRDENQISHCIYEEGLLMVKKGAEQKLGVGLHIHGIRTPESKCYPLSLVQSVFRQVGWKQYGERRTMPFSMNYYQRKIMKK